MCNWEAPATRRQNCNTEELTVLESAHEGHQGIVKTKSWLRTKVWWPKLDADAEKLCKSCQGCQVLGQFSPPEPMMRTEPPTGPW